MIMGQWDFLKYLFKLFDLPQLTIVFDWVVVQS